MGDVRAYRWPDISIHALLAESDFGFCDLEPIRNTISIHALLAESDQKALDQLIGPVYFYPRSPCGERPRVS